MSSHLFEQSRLKRRIIRAHGEKPGITESDTDLSTGPRIRTDVPGHRYGAQMVAPTVPLARVSLEGHLAGSEVFATSYWLALGTQGTAASALNIANDVVTRLGTNGLGATSILARMKTILGTSDGYDRVRVYTYVPGTVAAADSATAAIASGAGTGGRTAPFPTCIVVTLNTGKPGRANRGRMYFPYASSCAADGTISTSTIDAITTAVGDLFGSHKNSPLAGTGVVGVWSPTHGFFNEVTNVRGDNKPDVQRRRGQKVVAGYFKTYGGL